MNRDDDSPITLQKSGKIITNWETVGTLLVLVVGLVITYSAMRAADAELAKASINHEARIVKLEEGQSRVAEVMAEMRTDLKWLRARAEQGK